MTEDGRRQRKKEGGGKRRRNERKRARERGGRKRKGEGKGRGIVSAEWRGILYKDNILDSHTKSTGTARETKELNIFSKKIHSPK